MARPMQRSRSRTRQQAWALKNGLKEIGTQAPLSLGNVPHLQLQQILENSFVLAARDLRGYRRAAFGHRKNALADPLKPPDGTRCPHAAADRHLRGAATAFYPASGERRSRRDNRSISLPTRSSRFWRPVAGKHNPSISLIFAPQTDPLPLRRLVDSPLAQQSRRSSQAR